MSRFGLEVRALPVVHHVDRELRDRLARQRGDVAHGPQVALDAEDRGKPGLQVHVGSPELAGGGQDAIEDLTHRQRSRVHTAAPVGSGARDEAQPRSLSYPVAGCVAPSCGTENAPDSRFCGGCGARSAPRRVAPTQQDLRTTRPMRGRQPRRSALTPSRPPAPPRRASYAADSACRHSQRRHAPTPPRTRPRAIRAERIDREHRAAAAAAADRSPSRRAAPPSARGDRVVLLIISGSPPPAP